MVLEIEMSLPVAGDETRSPVRSHLLAWMQELEPGCLRSFSMTGPGLSVEVDLGAADPLMALLALQDRLFDFDLTITFRMDTTWISS